jgi:hypothetical protein
MYLQFHISYKKYKPIPFYIRRLKHKHTLTIHYLFVIFSGCSVIYWKLSFNDVGSAPV